MLDPVARDLEREHRHDDAVLHGHQPRLTVDRAFQERHVGGSAVGDFDPGARDLLAAFDGDQEGKGPAAAVGGRRGVGVEQADQGADVLGLPRLLEGPDQPGLIAQQDGVTEAVFAFETSADRITRIWAVRNPDKLRPWTAG